MTTVAYLINQYPRVSHSFIRREILALERQGVVIKRFAQRGWDADVVDPEDERERMLTRYILRIGAAGLLAAAAKVALSRPRLFVSTALLALRMGRRSDRSQLLHLIYLVEACCLVGWLHECGASHLHAHFGTNSAEIAMLARALGGPPYSFTVHGPEEFDKPEALHLREKIRRSAFAVAISSFGRSQLYRWVEPAQWPKVHVVHCGLEPSFAQGQAAEPSPVRRLVCVGRLCEQKGQLLLLDAAAQLRERGIDFELVLAGDGEMRGAIEERIAALRLGERVHITGWISGAHVREELLAARALVLPSFAEGLPVVIMEAMALGRPVVTTCIAGIPELVIDGEHGWLFPAGDVEFTARAIERCLAATQEDLGRMGRAARERVWARHDINLEARKLVHYFATVPESTFL